MFLSGASFSFTQLHDAISSGTMQNLGHLFVQSPVCDEYVYGSFYCCHIDQFSGNTWERYSSLAHVSRMPI
jgi:hypothetical protein